MQIFVTAATRVIVEQKVLRIAAETEDLDAKFFFKVPNNPESSTTGSVIRVGGGIKKNKLMCVKIVEDT